MPVHALSSRRAQDDHASMGPRASRPIGTARSDDRSAVTTLPLSNVRATLR
ncbi:MAG: hypothetical protein AVDCRST_MAG54-1671 [uncultured Actinomycetospora sp.]|uniref:Uncharacterized protein n=1 Tax=uncultured Actinomycetospora sp. TaxID=1135996 RepID=A0A6J4I9R7_9PSEU|nr:MAG: hypothetical protein AVDCRST_MAG54-1671 [uncultured Actinomycetospora sp.]